MQSAPSFGCRFAISNKGPSMPIESSNTAIFSLRHAAMVPNLDFDTRSDTPHAGIILLGPVDPAELAETLDAAPDTAIPIADFGGNHHTRSDFVGDRFDPAATA